MCEFGFRIGNMEGAELPLASASPCAVSPGTKQLCADIMNELGVEEAPLKVGEADNGINGTEEKKQSLVDRVVFLRNKSAELLVGRNDKPLRMVMNKTEEHMPDTGACRRVWGRPLV